MKITVEPVVHKDGYTALLENEVMSYFREVLFDPLREIVSHTDRINMAPSETDYAVLWTALMAGTVMYADGVFSGKFNAAISKALRALGATRRGDGFAIAQGDIPIQIRGAIATSLRRGKETHEEVLAFLAAFLGNVPKAKPGLPHTKVVDIILQDAQAQFAKTVAAVPELPKPTPTPEGLKTELVQGVATQTDFAIKNFTEETARKLRARVQENLSGGARTDRLAKIIEVEFGVAQRKARIIADAETSILVSRFRQRRYQELGSTHYVWQTAGDEKVRPTHGESNDHRSLDGRTFSWNEPPVVDSATGRRRHPGEDYGPCRCVARPIFTFSE